jgi:hypothetical protein
MLSEAEQLCIGFLADARNDIACHAERSGASVSGFLTAFGMNCDEKTKFQVLFKCSLTTRLWSQTELAVG